MKFSTKVCWLTCLLAFATSGLAAEVAYTLDPAHTLTRFGWAHLGYSHPEAGFDNITGTLMWDTADITKSSVKVSIAVESIHTHVPALDQKLVSPEFFDSSKFPQITFVSTRVERGKAKNKLKVTGDLTIHGITRPVVLDVTLNRIGIYPYLNVPAVGFDAATRFKRSEFGIAEGVPMVSDNIDVRISTEALEAVGFAKAMKAIQDNGGKQ